VEAPVTEIEEIKELGTKLTPAEQRRRTTMMLFGSVMVLGLILSGTYVVLRTMAPQRVQSKVVTRPVARALPQPKPAPPVSSLASTPSTPSPVAPPVARPERTIAESKVPAIKLPPLPRRPSQPGHPVTEPTPGAFYLQVGALDKTAAEVFVEALSQKGFSSVITPGPDEKTFRVLVGPSNSGADIRVVQGGLAKAGFNSFVRRIPGPGNRNPSGA
jgi:cell division protein FtsN